MHLPKVMDIIVLLCYHQKIKQRRIFITLNAYIFSFYYTTKPLNQHEYYKNPFHLPYFTHQFHYEVSVSKYHYLYRV